jgi:hypothetical protein
LSGRDERRDPIGGIGYTIGGGAETKNVK